MNIDWIDKLRSFLHTLAFCLAISAVLFGLQPQRPYELALVYSLCIGCSTWALIDFGRHLAGNDSGAGWPQGLWGKLFPVLGILLGYVIGVAMGDWWLGRSSWASTSLQNTVLSVLLSAGIGAVITYYFYSSKKSAHLLQQEVSQANRLATEARLKLLEAQLEPHMLFNTLANLRVLIGTDPARAQDMLDHIIAYLRSTLSASRASSHPLEQEMQRLRDYLELMAVRMGPRLHYVLDLPPELAQHSVPTLLLQPLVENSIKHGLEPKIEGGTVTVRARREGQTLTLEVTDTGAGFDTQATPSSGFGLAQVRERMATAYASLGSVEQTSTPGQGTSVLLHLPIDASSTSSNSPRRSEPNQQHATTIET